MVKKMSDYFKGPQGIGLGKVYLKNMQKRWVSGILLPGIIIVMVTMVTGLWPAFEEQAVSISALLDNPVYQGILGMLSLQDLSTFAGFFNMYAFIMIEYVMLFATIFIPARLISGEVEKNTFDIVLSYPIPRWRYILEKYGVYLTYNLLYPAFIMLSALISSSALNETLDYVSLAYASLGVLLRFFTLGSISLLCGALFLKNKRAVGASGALIFGQYILDTVGGIAPEGEWMTRDFSLPLSRPWFTRSCWTSPPLGEVFGVLGVGIAFLIAALFVFQKRELAI